MRYAAKYIRPGPIVAVWYLSSYHRDLMMFLTGLSFQSVKGTSLRNGLSLRVPSPLLFARFRMRVFLTPLSREVAFQSR